MPQLRRILHERFALLYANLAAQGMGNGQIYAAAGGQASNKRSKEVMGSRIYGRPDVKKRISELAKGAVAKAGRDAEHYLGRLDQVFTGSIEDREFGYAARATELGAKISGILVDRVETSITFTGLRTVDEIGAALLDEHAGSLDAALATLDQMREVLIGAASARAKVINGGATISADTALTKPAEPEKAE